MLNAEQSIVNEVEAAIRAGSLGVGFAARRAASALTNRIIEDGIMTDQQGSTARLPDPVELSQTMARGPSCFRTTKRVRCEPKIARANP